MESGLNFVSRPIAFNDAIDPIAGQPENRIDIPFDQCFDQYVTGCRGSHGICLCRRLQRNRRVCRRYENASAPMIRESNDALAAGVPRTLIPSKSIGSTAGTPRRSASSTRLPPSLSWCREWLHGDDGCRGGQQRRHHIPRVLLARRTLASSSSHSASCSPA